MGPMLKTHNYPMLHRDLRVPGHPTTFSVWGYPIVGSELFLAPQLRTLQTCTKSLSPRRVVLHNPRRSKLRDKDFIL